MDDDGDVDEGYKTPSAQRTSALCHRGLTNEEEEREGGERGRLPYADETWAEEDAPARRAHDARRLPNPSPSACSADAPRQPTTRRTRPSAASTSGLLPVGASVLPDVTPVPALVVGPPDIHTPVVRTPAVATPNAPLPRWRCKERYEDAAGRVEEDRPRWAEWFTATAAAAAAPPANQHGGGGARATLHGVPASLARLLCMYTPPPPPQPPVEEGGEERDAPRGAASPPGVTAVAPSTQNDRARKWCAFLPFVIADALPLPLPPSPPPFVTTRLSQRQQQQQPETPQQHQQQQRCARRPTTPQPHHQRVRDRNFTDFQRNIDNHERLWFLLQHHAHDASGCLALCFSVCHVLHVMRCTPPPPSPRLHPLSPRTADSGGAEVHEACPCGCLIRGCFADPLLQAFHAYYHRLHLPRDEMYDAERQSQHATVSTAAADEGASGGGADTSGDGEASLAELQADLQVEVMPLLAIQTLAEFVWRSSEKSLVAHQRHRERRTRREAAIAERKRRREGSVGRGAKRPVRDRATPRAGGEAEVSVAQQREQEELCQQRHATITASHTLSSSAVDTSSAAFAGAYQTFCTPPEHLWAVMACVDLAWSQLEQCATLAFFAPQLTVCCRRPHHAPPLEMTQRFPSALEKAAAEAALTVQALTEVLVQRPVSPSGPVAQANPHADALRYLRARLLACDYDATRHSRDAAGPGDKKTREGEEPPSHLPRAARKLIRMKEYMCVEVGGRTAQMPLWCAVALETLQLYGESRRRGHRERRAALGTVPIDVVAAAEAEERILCRQARLLVRVMARLLLLPTLSQSADSPVSASVSAPAAEPDATWQLSLSTLSSWMQLHPLFGVAVVVMTEAVPLLWAATCVTGTSFRCAAELQALGMSCSFTNVMIELERLMQHTQRMLRAWE